MKLIRLQTISTFDDGTVITSDNNTGFVTTTPITSTVRYSLAQHMYKMNASGFTIGQPVLSISDLKGKLPLPYTGPANPVLTGKPPIYTKEGVLFFQNQANTHYSAKSSAIAPYPMEIWMVILKPNYFMFEAFCGGYGGLYFADLGSASPIRLTNDNDAAHMFQNSVIPVNQFFSIRFRLTSNGNNVPVNVEMWINGVKQTNSVQVLTWFSNQWNISIGTDTNNNYCGFAEYLYFPVLTDAQAAQVEAELQSEYQLGQPIQLPYADQLQLTVAGGSTSVTYKFNNVLGFDEDTTKRVVRWIAWGNNGVTNATYLPQYNGLLTIPIALKGRVEITCFDVKGNYYSMASSKAVN